MLFIRRWSSRWSNRWQRCFRRFLSSPPRMPYVSTMSGTWITADQATDPHYWARHCRETVRYAAALACLAEPLSPILIEVGPGRTLTSLARQNEGARGAPLIAASLPDPGEQRDAEAVFLDTLGRLWAAGGAPNWRALYEGAPQRHVVLPTYPLQRKRYFMNPPKCQPGQGQHHYRQTYCRQPY